MIADTWGPRLSDDMDGLGDAILMTEARSIRPRATDDDPTGAHTPPDDDPTGAHMPPDDDPTGAHMPPDDDPTGAHMPPDDDPALVPIPLIDDDPTAAHTPPTM